MRAEEFENPKDNFVEMFRKFLPLAMKIIGLKSLPRMVFEKEIYSPEQPTFGQYVNDEHVLHVGLANRHPNDILRTIAHELVHYKQDTEHKLNDMSGATGSPEENEANALAGIVMRNFNKRYPEYLKTKPIVNEGAGAVTFAGKDPNEFKSPKGGKPVMVVVTDQGSRYLITSDGMVLRHKSVHANTGGDDAGLQAWSDKIEFYDRSKPLVPAGMQNMAFPDAVTYLFDKGRIALSKGQSGERLALIADKGAWRPATIADAMPKAAAAKPEWAKIVIKADAGTWGTQPKLGWQPLDYNQRADGTLNRVHNGSPVSHGAKVQQSLPEYEMLDEGIMDFISKAKDKFLRLKDALADEWAQSKEMWKIVQKGDMANSKEISFANSQFKDILRVVGLAAWYSLPIPGNTLLILTTEKLLNKVGMSIIPDKIRNQVLNVKNPNVAEDNATQYVAALYVDEFADGDHWYIKGTPDVIQRFVQLANSLEDEAVKGTEYEPGVGMMAKIHKDLGDDSIPQWKIVPATNLEQIKPITGASLRALMTADLSDGAGEFMSDFLWNLEEKGQALVHDGSEQNVSENFDKEAEAWRDWQLKMLPRKMEMLSKLVKGWVPSEEDHIAAIEAGYNAMKNTGDVKDAAKAISDTFNKIQRQQGVAENFADGRNPQDKGDSARHGIRKGMTIAQLKKIRSSDSASPRKKQLAHWQINMRQGQKKNESITDNKSGGYAAKVNTLGSFLKSFVDIPSWDKSGSSKVVRTADDRVSVLINIGGVYIPFYCSTGEGGKVTVPAGKWYPFFGFGPGGWINKGSEKSINAFYGSGIFKTYANVLNLRLGDLRDDETVPYIKKTGRDVFNRDMLNPQDNVKTTDDANLFKKRVNAILVKVGSDPFYKIEQ